VKVAGAKVRPGSLAYVLWEDGLIMLSLLGGFALAHYGSLTPLRSPLGAFRALLILVGIKLAFYWSGLYQLGRVAPRPEFWKRLGMGLGISALVAWGICGLFRSLDLACLAFLTLFLPCVILSRTAYEFLTGLPRYKNRLLFLGVGEHARRTAKEILDERSRHYEVIGFLAENEAGLGWRIGGRPVFGTYADLPAVVKAQGIDSVVVAVEDRRQQLPLGELLALRLSGTQIIEEAKIHEDIAGKIPVEDLRPSWLIFSDGFVNDPLRTFSKRCFDLLFAIMGMILSAPLWPLVALAVRCTSKGPVLYRQVRVGQGGKEFLLAKFRSMRIDAEAPGSPQWAQKNDPRVTPVGRFLRKTRLDELPQLWNVLRGSMSFVGPRPERPFFVEGLRRKIPYYDQRHAVKPGLTGWAQVRFRYGSDESDAVEKLRLDMYYVKHHSILFDLRILMETVKVVLEGSKSR